MVALDLHFGIAGVLVDWLFDGLDRHREAMARGDDDVLLKREGYFVTGR